MRAEIHDLTDVASSVSRQHRYIAGLNRQSSEQGTLETTDMDAVVLLSVLSTINPGNAFDQLVQSDLPGSLVVTAFLLLVIAGWSIQGGLAQRRDR